MIGLGPTARVVPSDVTTSANPLSAATTFLTKWLHAWRASQLSSFGGKYSIERMLALEEYNRNASVPRVVLALIRLPLVVFTIVMCQEAVPLQQPSEGWQANYGFWVRVGCAGVAASYAVTSQIGLWLNVRPLSVKQSVAYYVFSGSAFVAVGVAVAAVSVFPVPFFMLMVSPPSALVLGVGLRIVLGAEEWKCMLSSRRNLRQFSKIIVLSGVMYAGYPVYQLLFTKMNHTPYELPVLLILPVLKFVLKLFFMTATNHQEEMMPELVVFTVNFFDILYLATFMQSVSSSTMAVLMAIDLFHSVLSLLSLHKRSQEIAANIRQVFGAEIPVTEPFNLLTSIRSLCSHPQLTYSQLRPGIRVKASVPHQLPAEARDLLGRLERHLVCNSDKGNFTKSEPKVDNVRAKRVLCRSLEVLFTSECLVLAEYVEFVVPLLYAAFVWTMGHLPSARYHSEMEGLTADNVGTAVTGILAYALLELTSFVALAIITKRSCGIHTLYQLAFVLETQSSLIVSKVMVWMLFTLAFRVVHFGADFSFRFQWIHHT